MASLRSRAVLSGKAGLRRAVVLSRRHSTKPLPLRQKSRQNLETRLSISARTGKEAQ